jgi:hypothetical protein
MHFQFAKLKISKVGRSQEAYVLIAQSEKRVDVFKRGGDVWTFETFSNSGEINLPCLHTPLTLDETYQGLIFAPTPGRA